MVKRTIMSTIVHSVCFGMALVIYLSLTYHTALSNVWCYSLLFIVPSIMIVSFLFFVINKGKYSLRWTKYKFIHLSIRVISLMIVSLACVGLAIGAGYLVEMQQVDIGILCMMQDGSFYFWALIPVGTYSILEFLLGNDDEFDPSLDEYGAA